MANTYQLAVSNFSASQVSSIILDVANTNNSYYLFVGNPLAWHDGLYPFSTNLFGTSAQPAGDDPTHVPEDTVSQFISTFQTMVFGKLLQPTNVLPMIRRYDWTGGTVYAQYDSESDLSNSAFYVVTNDTSDYHVFKCISNNRGAPSEYPPTFNDTAADDQFYQTTDQYQWKYMYTIDNSTFRNFATAEFIPVVANANVSGNAVSGAVDMINVVDGGAFYNHYISGQFNSADIQIGGNPLLYGAPGSANGANGFYTGAILTIDEGKGKGQFRLINDYRVIGTTKEMVINAAFSTTPDPTSKFSIAPKVTVIGDGKQTVNCEARALVNAAQSNTVYAVEILNRGTNYRFAAASVDNNLIAPTANVANLAVISPPPGGHGYNAQYELGGRFLGISVQVGNTESNTISTQNDFRTIGLIKNPLYSNVVFAIVDSDGNPGSNGTFIPTETVYAVSPIALRGTVSVNTTSSTIHGTGTKFINGLSANDYVILESNTGLHQFAQVSSIANNIALALTVNCVFTDTVATVSKILIDGTGVVSAIAAGQITVTNSNRAFNNGKYVIGGASYATANIASFVVNGITKTYSTINQLVPYVGTVVAGTFSPDELVSQVSSTANAYFHSLETVSGSTVAYLTNEVGIFNINDTFVGQVSGAIFSITNKYIGDLTINSGTLLYLENFQPISRGNNQTELMKVIVEL